MKGIARNTPVCKKWLETEAGISNIREVSGELIMFEHDGRPRSGAPEGVFFDLAAAPF